jgi:hypothetical protein
MHLDRNFEMNMRESVVRNGKLGCWLTLVFALAGCAQLPSPVAELPWMDLWGDRGAGVLARDYEMCERLVEQRRGLLEGCMTARGWSVRPIE